MVLVMFSVALSVMLVDLSGLIGKLWLFEGLRRNKKTEDD